MELLGQWDPQHELIIEEPLLRKFPYYSTIVWAVSYQEYEKNHS